jgi:hypothetical protein
MKNKAVRPRMMNNGGMMIAKAKENKSGETPDPKLFCRPEERHKHTRDCNLIFTATGKFLAASVAAVALNSTYKIM